MSKISVYNVVPTPKLGDKLIGTSVGVVDEVFYDVTYNFTLQELLDLFIPNIPANNLQGVLNYGNTATQDINLTGTINTTNINVLATATILDSVLNGETHILGQLYDGLNSSGTAGQILKSTGSGVEWYTIPDAVIPTLQQVLNSGNTADKNIILSANISASTATANTVVSNTSLNINGVLKDGSASVGASNQILSSTVTGVQWVDLPVYSATSPLLFDGPTKTFSIQVANSTQGGYLSNTDWINFDAKQNPISLTTTGNSGAATFVGSVLNIPAYTLSGLGGVASVSANSPLSSSGGENPIISIPMADTSHSGYLTNTDWNTFNTKQGALTLTTLGTSGPSTLVGTTLNIPQYQPVLVNPITGLGTVNYVPKFDTTSSITNSNIQDDGSLITLGSNTTISSGALGIGTSSLTGYNLRIIKPLTGATTSYGIVSGGAVFTDVTSNATYFASSPSTNASVNLTALTHYYSLQGSFDISSVVGTQRGFWAASNLIGATVNIGFAGSIASGSNRWNLYMDGTADNYLAGSLGIGTLDLTSYNLRINKNITGATTAYSILTEGTIQSDVTNARMFNSKPATVDSTFTITNLSHYLAQQGTFGASSTVTSQYGFFVDTSLIGAANNYAFYSSLAAATNRWNLYMNGTANNYLAGALGIGSTSLTGYGLRLALPITGSISSVGFLNSGIIQSDVTSSTYYNRTSSATAAASFTLTNIYHYGATQGTFGAGSTVTNQYGFLVASSLTGATNNYAYVGQLAAATNVWNLYMSGTANNYLAGSLGIGTPSLTGYNLRVTKNITGATIAYGASIDGAVQSDVTNQAHYYVTNAQTQASTFTISNIFHYRAIQGTFGLNSTVSSQAGFAVDSTLIGATNNYGFFGNIALGANRWNIYMAGTADNYLGGSLGMGSSSLTGINLRIEKNIIGGAISTANFAISVHNAPIIQSDVTSTYWGFNSQPSTVASLALTNLVHFQARFVTLGSGASVTNQTGFLVPSNLNGGTNNYGFRGLIASASNAWNLYMDGTANNYLAGNLGIGTTSLTGYELRIGGSITGATTAYGVSVDGTIQSDVTTSPCGYNSNLSTAAASFAINTLYHYRAQQGTIGAGSSVSLQIGFDVANTLTGATTNIGYRSQLNSGTNVWNLYMNGTANNYLAGSLGIGTVSLTGFNFRIDKNVTGGISAYGAAFQGNVQSDVTNQAFGVYSGFGTQAATFTLPNLYNFYVTQGTFGAGSTVTNQYGFYVSSSLTGATNNFGFRGELAAATNVWNLYMNGTANNYLAGNLGIGTTTLSNVSLNVNKSITGSTTSNSIISQGAVQSDVTTAAYYISSFATTQATTFTLNLLTHFRASQGTFGAGSTVTTQYGFNVDANLVGATNNYAFLGGIPSGTNNWNIYMSGTANNYLAGSLGIGATSLTGYNLRINKTLTGATASRNIWMETTIASDVTSSAVMIGSFPSTQSASFTLNSLYHYYTNQGTIGSGSSVTNQFGFYVESLLVGATNNYGFYGNIPAGTNRWNLCMAGTAQNYLAGALSIGVTTANASAILQVDSTTQGVLFPRMTTTQKNAIASPATGLVVFDTTLGKLCVFSTTWQTITSV